MRDSIIFHRKDSFGMNFQLNVERDFLKLTPLCNVTICTTSENSIFQKNSRPLDKVALRNLYKVELGESGFFLLFFTSLIRDASDITNAKKRSRREREERNVIFYYTFEANYFMYNKTNATRVKFLKIIAICLLQYIPTCTSIPYM